MVIYNTNDRIRRESDVPTFEPLIADRPVMLALSSFYRSFDAVNLAIEKHRSSQKLVIAFGHHINEGLLFLESEVGLISGLKDRCRQDLISGYERHWSGRVKKIAALAESKGIEVTAYVEAENFLKLCIKIAERQRPELIVMSNTRQFVRNGLCLVPVPKYLSDVCGCEVISV